jgi:hypothetical protein
MNKGMINESRISRGATTPSFLVVGFLGWKDQLISHEKKQREAIYWDMVGLK